MEKNIAYYKSIQNASGTTSKKEYEVSKLKNSISKHFGDSIDFEPDTKVDNIAQKLMVIKTKDDYIKTVIAYPTETIKVGQTIDCYSKKYLVISVDSKTEVFTQGKMQECNYILKFQSQTGTILSYPCITSNKTSGSGENADKLMTLGDGMKSVKLPYDEMTIWLHNDEDKTYRFFLDLHPTKPVPYKLTFADTTSNHFGDSGIIELIMKEDKINPITDRIDLGICDYFEPDDVPIPPDPDVPTEIVTITSDAENNKVMLGVTHTFSAEFKNQLGEDIVNVVAQYSVDNTYGGKVVLVDNGDGTATIKVGSYKDNYLCTEQFSLTCTDKTHGFDSTVLLTIVGMY